MKRSIRNRLVTVLMIALMAIVTLSCAVSVFASTETDGFRMEAGAAIRVTAPDGIRFQASIDEIPEGATFGALVIPEKLLEEGKLDEVRPFTKWFFGEK